MAITKVTEGARTLGTDEVVTANVADNAVTLVKLEDGTQGDILYYGASGAPTRLGFGTSGDFLKTQGTGANPAWATAGGGKVLQVVQSTDLSTTAITSTTFSDIGLSVDITPSATTSKVFCTVVFSYTQDGFANALAYIQMVRDTTALTSNNVGVDSTFGNVGWICVSQYLDSPSTTSATTYKMQAKTSNASSEFRPYFGDGYASIVCMEMGA